MVIPMCSQKDGAREKTVFFARNDLPELQRHLALNNPHLPPSAQPAFHNNKELTPSVPNRNAAT